MPKIKDLPKHEMPREKLIEKGPENLRNSELLAILLRTGTEGKNVIEVAEQILQKYPMKKLLSLDFENISKIKGIGESKATSLLASFELVKRALDKEDNSLPVINSVHDVISQLQDIKTAKKEHFIALYINARNQLIRKETISIGTINASLVHPREIFKPAIDFLAVNVIIAHNHPSGDINPSEEDIELTERLKEAGKIMGVDVLDHIIVTPNGYSSMKENGELKIF